MNLVLFDDALEHLTRIHRVIRMDQGHALLVGVGGSGKQSLCKLASYAAGCDVFEITLSRGYGESSFRDDLKILYNKLGMENKKTVFLFTDQHVAEEGTVFMYSKKETPAVITTKLYYSLYNEKFKIYLYKVFNLLFKGFLELINNMLTSGMVPALYADDEKESIVGSVCRLASTQMGKEYMKLLILINITQTLQALIVFLHSISAVF